GDLSVGMRGVSDEAFLARPKIKVIAGRRFTQGSDEAMIGKGLVGRVEGFQIGGGFRFGRRSWRVVGIFDDDGGTGGSEIWGDASAVMDDDRRDFYSSALLPLKPGASADTLIARIEGDKRFSLHAQRESDYYKSQTGSAEPMRALTAIVAFIMGLGA